MKRYNRPRLSPDPRESERIHAIQRSLRYEQIHMVEVKGKMYASRAALDRMHKLSSSGISDAIVNPLGMPVEEATFLPYWRKKARPSVERWRAAKREAERQKREREFQEKMKRAVDLMGNIPSRACYPIYAWQAHGLLGRLT